ncbi:MAG: tetratricopeptide repeat-containing glycosyltransferase family protein [Geobacteraceae bacterium]|nr:tetratricopeptide repeat-containing glycosyltransferase family protein [Geobacteraceae bacterium]
MNLRDHRRDPAGDICPHPSEVEAFLKLGAALHAEERYEEAVAVYRHAIGLKPDFGVAYHNMGNSLMELGRWEEAIASYRNGIRLIPSFSEGYVTIATALQALHKPYEAMASCHRALAMDPACAEAHWNLALALLQAGEFREGWKEFEWRWQKRGFTSKARDFDQPLWDGSPLQDRTILIHSEQGFGDTFQFVRYIPLVSARGGTVVLECPLAQKTLLAGVPGVSEVVARGEKLPAFDVHLPIMSLPLVCNTRMDNIPLQIPYIFPQVDSIAAWADKFEDNRKFRVGLVWAGRKKPDPNRTCPLHMFSPLAGIPGTRFYSLQMRNEMSSSDGMPGKLELADYTPGIRDFSDTAALIAHLDLVISIDTGVAHLAGAMGKETWVLLPFAADWRWMLDRDDSPWYPTMRLFRQDRPGDWRGPVESVRRELSRVAGFGS